MHNQLVFDGYTVHVGHLRAGEIDFVASGNSGERFYIQVTETMLSEERESGTGAAPENPR